MSLPPLSFRPAAKRSWSPAARATDSSRIRRRLAASALIGAAGLIVFGPLLVAEDPRPAGGARQGSDGSRAAADGPKLDDVGPFMRMKLAHSGEVLEGLALEDFGKIAQGANALALASQASSWQVLQTEDYARYSAEFRRSCESLRSAARAENLDGAALAWMEVTMKCIQCHRYVRSAERESR